MTGPRPGLCGSCRHAQTVVSDRGSRFWLCRLAKRDPSFRRYPRLPVRECDGYEPDGDDETEGEIMESRGEGNVSEEGGT